MNDLTPLVTYCAVIAGLVCLLIGLVMTIIDFINKYSVTKKAATEIDTAKARSSGGALAEQGAVSDVLESASKLAEALKGLDTGTRVLVLSIAFLAVAAVAVGVDSIAAAIAK